MRGSRVQTADGHEHERLQALVGAQADVNALNERRESPLHLLAVSPAFETVQAVSFLLEHGARILRLHVHS